jgi:hypothetical protein
VVTQATVFALPEDRAEDAPEVLRHLIAHASAAAGVSTAITFQRAPPDIAKIAVGRRWAAKRRDNVSFVQWIATQLRLGAVVVVHYDADVTWPKRRRCPNRDQFAKQVRTPVSHLSATDDLVEMVPFSMIEAWTYRNTSLASALAPEDALHAAATADPECLERRPRIKDASPLGDRCNLRLVTESWPAAEAYADERSFRAFADALAVAPALR